MTKTNKNRVGSEAQYGPRLAGEILHDYLENSNEPLAVAYREHSAEEKGWNVNTELGCDVKTFLRSEKRMKTGKEYQGVLRRDSDAIDDEFLCRDAHFTFIEVEPWSTKRNPRVFNGKFISITRRDDGTLRLNFKPRPETMSIDYYAFEVYREIRNGLNGLVEK